MHRLLLSFLCLTLVIAALPVAMAGSFQVHPLRVDLSAQQTTSMLTIHNQGDAPATMQVRLLTWSQRSGEDVHEATRELLATPPIFTIPSHGQQIVRIGMRRKPDAQRELSYRLLLEEVPNAALPESEPGVNMLMRFSLPVFVATPAKPVVERNWRALLSPAGELRLSLDNRGNRHAKVAVLTVSRPSGTTPLLKHEGLTYVLSDQQRSWSLRPEGRPQPGETLKIVAQSDEGSFDAEVTLERE